MAKVDDPTAYSSIDLFANLRSEWPKLDAESKQYAVDHWHVAIILDDLTVKGLVEGEPLIDLRVARMMLGWAMAHGVVPNESAEVIEMHTRMMIKS